MSFLVNLKYLEGVPGKGSRFITLTFRGDEKFSKIVSGGLNIYLGEQFIWPIGRKIDGTDFLDLRVFQRNKYVDNKLVGNVSVCLQALSAKGKLLLNEALINENNAQMQVTLSFDLIYNSPDAVVGDWRTEDFEYPIIEPRIHGNSYDVDSLSSGFSRHTIDFEPVDIAPRRNSESTILSMGDSESIMSSQKRGSIGVPAVLDPTLHTLDELQITVTIGEARQLAGANLNPLIEVQVGQYCKRTEFQLSTNSPFFNNYFRFDFRMSKMELFDQVLRIKAINVGSNIITRLFPGHLIGEFTMDVKTIYDSHDHMFFNKWAMLVDPNDVMAGAKGYVKCDLIFTSRDHHIKVKQKKIGNTDDDDIDANMLIPRGMQPKRQVRDIQVKIYRAEDLPRMQTDIMASIKKAISGEEKPLTDPYVQVSFGGLVGKTTTKKNTYNPIWNEEVIFSDFFPPLANRIRISVYDWDAVYNECVATHFIDLKSIMSDRDPGFLPTFGPSWINLYGLPRNYTYDQVVHPKDELSRGLGEGVAYRGRLLMAIKMPSEPDPLDAAVRVKTSCFQQAHEMTNPKKEEFLLAGIVYQACAIDKEIGSKNSVISIEMTMGYSNNPVDGEYTGSEQERSNQEQGCDNMNTSTPPIIPITEDGLYYHIPFNETKPFLNTTFFCEDHRQRLWAPNILDKLGQTYKRYISKLEKAIKYHLVDSHRFWKTFFVKLINTTRSSLNALKSCRGTATKTMLDKERGRLRRIQVEKMCIKLETMRDDANAGTAGSRLRELKALLKVINDLAIEPQQCMPDVFIWMIVNKKRVAFSRISPRQIVHSPVEEQKGRDCGEIVTLFFRKPGRKGVGQSGWPLQAQVNMFLWLGMCRDASNYVDCIPEGFDTGFFRPTRPPPCIVYKDTCNFQLRAHIFMARNLISANDSGLSDPFAKIVIDKDVLETRVIKESLSPKWDESIVLRDVKFYMDENVLKAKPPIVIVEVFDHDTFGSAEFLGRCFAKPQIVLTRDIYKQPQLNWWDLYRGQTASGDVLAAFELIQMDSKSGRLRADIKDSETLRSESMSRVGEKRKQNFSDRSFPVPDGIRPNLVRYRMEVIFWGLRNLSRVQLFSVDQPFVKIELGNKHVDSDTIQSVKIHSNFTNPVKYVNLKLPENKWYWPPILIQCYDHRQFGRRLLVGNHVVSSALDYIKRGDCQGYSGSKTANLTLNVAMAATKFLSRKQSASPIQEMASLEPAEETTTVDQEQGVVQTKEEELDSSEEGSTSSDEIKTFGAKPGKARRRKTKPTNISREELDELDWWSRYYASLQEAAKEDAGDSDNRGPTEKKGRKKLGNFLKSIVSKKGYDNKAMATTISDESSCNEDVLRDITFELESETGRDEDIAEMSAKAESDVGQTNRSKSKRKKKLTKEQKQRLKKIKREKKREKKRKRHQMLFQNAATKFLSENGGDADKRNKLDLSWIDTMKIYSTPLEDVEDFHGLEDFVRSYPIYRGKQEDDDEPSSTRTVGTFKGQIRIYPIDEHSSTEHVKTHNLTLSKGLPLSSSVNLIVRVYVVNAQNLFPTDTNGLADPYLIVKLGNQSQTTRDNYIPKQLNPVFGRCFEFEAEIPRESTLTVQVFDYDMVGSDDFIGETDIDIENRYYTKHRATCGLPLAYSSFGYNKWRDQQTPTQILSALCKENDFEPPVYDTVLGQVNVNGRDFDADTDLQTEAGETIQSNEPLALTVLHKWDSIKGGYKLVPEHIETRPIYTPDKPGVEQGHVMMWVDILPRELGEASPIIDITPRVPQDYELRVIIWDTADVILNDSGFLTGEKSSDVFVKAWVKGVGIDDQVTDVHYRSLSGEGNFNFRFVFRFGYLKAEDRMVYYKKDSIFSLDDTEVKVPCRLYLQVWDADIIAPDSFLGTLSFSLSNIPRGAKSANACGLHQTAPNASVPTFSLFQSKRSRGWWPFEGQPDADNDSTFFDLTGKVDAEFELVTAAEADDDPVGLGRNDPHALPPPNRPESSFLWFTNPMKTCKYIIWKNYKWLILQIFLFLLLVAFLVLFIYSSPGYLSKKMLGV